MWFWRKAAAVERREVSSEVTLEAIGWVRNAVQKPRPRGWERVGSLIELAPEHAGKLRGLEGYSHIMVVFYMDLAATAPEKPEELTLASGNRYGLFATRSQLRPNHLGVSVVPLLELDAARCRIRTRGLDAVDGTAVLDIKPYLPEYDSVPGARIPR